MPAPLGPLPTTGFDLDEAAHTIRFIRRLSAAPDAVFAAWTRPEEISTWWDPSGAPLVRCDIDLRVGGTFAFVAADHPDMPFTGVYREISRPSRLVFDALGAEGRVLLEPDGAGTAMTVEIVCANEAHLQQFVAMGVAGGTSATLDNLVRRLGTLGGEAAA